MDKHLYAFRVATILSTPVLQEAVSGYPAFHLRQLDLPSIPPIYGPSNLRLGQLMEGVVGQLIAASKNYVVEKANIQLKSGGVTLGELDFVIAHRMNGALFHVEVAYKFYLFDPFISSPENGLANWVGPNRRDSLLEKLEKLRTKQFPMLHSLQAQQALVGLDINKMEQRLCMMVHGFIPFKMDFSDTWEFHDLVCGYYAPIHLFLAEVAAKGKWYMPSKKQWGLVPENHQEWHEYSQIENAVTQSIAKEQSVLVWRKITSRTELWFITWW